MTGQDACTIFDKLYDETYLPAARYVARRCADSGQVQDILQEVYADVYDAIVRRGPDYIRDPLAFVLNTAAAKLTRYYDKRRREAQVLSLDALRDGDDGGQDLPDTEAETVEEAAVTDALLAEIMTRVRQEPPETQRIFSLYYGFGLTSREIAGELGLGDATVRSRLHRITQKLRQELRKDETTA